MDISAFTIDVLQRAWDARGHVFLWSIPLVTLLLIIEAFYFGWQRSALRKITVERGNSSRLDVVICVLHAVNLDSLIAFALTLGIVSGVPDFAQRIFGVSFVALIPSPYLQAAVYLLLYDFLWYWKHRLAHKFDWWWQLHEVHHSATEMNIIASNRFHPLDTYLGEVMVALPLALAGAPPEHYAAARLVLLIHGHLLHSDFPWDYGWIGRGLLISPQAHRIHHSAESRQMNSNFGTLTPAWDRMFGTWCEDRERTALICEDGNHHHAGWLRYLWQSYLRALRAAARSLTGLARRGSS